MASSFDDTSNSEKSLKFKDDLMKFFTEQRKENLKWPVVSGKDLDLHKLFCEVMKRGGYENVNKTRQWKEVVSTLNLPPTCTSATFTISSHYKKYLLSYEKHICSGGTTQHISSTTSSSVIHPSLRSPYQQGHYMAHQQMNSNSSSLTKQTQYLNQPTRNEEEKYLGKKVLRTDPELNFFFRNPITKPTALKTKSNFKKINLWNAILDTKRVELAFESHLTSEIYWAINNLLLFSADLNTSNTVGMGGVILIESQPYLMESMTNYIYYCVNNINSLYFIIDIIQGKQVDEHERLKEKLNWMFYKRNINTISSQGSSTSLYSKESKRSNLNMNNSHNNVNNSNNSSNMHSSSMNVHAAVTRSRGSVINNNNTMINAQSQLSNNTTTLNAINVKPSMYYINNNNYNHNKGDFTFLDITNHTSPLPFLSKRNKDLKEIDQVKTLTSLTDDNSSDVNTKQEEITEHELCEILISLIQIIRNLSFIAANEGSIFKSTKFMHMLYLLFIHSNLTEIVLNSLDIITNLSKNIVLKDCQYAPLLMEKLYKCLISSNRELSEQALECFKRLVLTNGNEEYFEKMPDEFIYEIVNLLISPKNDIRDSALEILYCLSDQKISTKTRLGETDKLIQRLVALICTNSNDNRISKFAACVLSKLAEIPNILTLIMPYEQELFLAAATDESLTKMLLGIISN